MFTSAPWQDTSHDLCDEAALCRVYDSPPPPAALTKVCDHVHPLYRPFIEAAPFAVLATRGPRGLDTSPRGDAPGFVQIPDDKTLLLPDRRGNHRIDSLRNLVADPELALLFLVPGCREALRVNGHGRISAHPELLSRFVVDGHAPRSVLVIEVRSVFFQCGRALLRSQLWEPQAQIDRSRLPSVGRILQTLSDGDIDGAAYDAALPARQRSSLY